MKTRVYEGGKQFDAIKELEEAIIRVWNNLSLKDDVHPLISSIENRVTKLLKVNGRLIN